MKKRIKRISILEVVTSLMSIVVTFYENKVDNSKLVDNQNNITGLFKIFGSC